LSDRNSAKSRRIGFCRTRPRNDTRRLRGIRASALRPTAERTQRRIVSPCVARASITSPTLCGVRPTRIQQSALTAGRRRPLGVGPASAARPMTNVPSLVMIHP
jgi:hypothetical protein